MRSYEFTVVIERDEDGRFVATCPLLQGCYTEGVTVDEARELIADAVALHVRDRIDCGERVPEEIAAYRVGARV